MDSFTQAVLGAAVGHAVAGRRLGRVALAAGAIAGTLPDLDTFAIAPLGPLAEWQYHRGVTHSLFFGPVVGPLLGWLSWRGFRRWRPERPGAAADALTPWMLLWVLSLVTHPLLDLFTHYGTQLLAPLSDARFAIPAVGIIDPVYTLPLLSAVILAWISRTRRIAGVACAVALTATSGYLFYGWSQNQSAEAEARRQLAAAGSPAPLVRAYPTVFQPYLRRIVTQDADSVRVGFVTTWSPGPITWTCIARPRGVDAAVVMEARRAPAALVLDWFADGQVWGERQGDAVRLTDLRYGFPGSTALGWWGVDVPIGADGRPTGPGRRIAVPRGASLEAVTALFAAGYGEIGALYAATGTPVPALQARGSCPPEPARAALSPSRTGG